MAKQKYSPNDIESINDDWGLDTKDTEQRPYSGRAVQKFIKDTLNKKMGYFYYDTSNNRYIAFASVEDKDLYIEDPTRTDLILGTFDAPFNFTASVSLISKATNIIFKGTTGNYIEYTFDIVDKSGASTMEGIDVIYTFISKGLKKTASASYTYGTKVSFNIDDYLSTGETIVQIAITGKDTLAATTRSVSYRILDLSLTSNYNIGQVNDVTENSYIQIPYTLTSSTHVALQVSVDEDGYTQIMETDAYVTNGSYQLDTTSLNEGKHNIRLCAQVRIDSELYYSDIVYKEFIVSRGSINTDLILFEGIIPVIYKDDYTFKLYNAQRYLPYSFTIAVYSVKSAQSTVNLQFVNSNQIQYIGDKILSNNTSEEITFTPLTSGSGKIQATVGDITESVDINVIASSIAIEEITNQLELALNAQGRSNQDADKESWVYENYSTVFKGFTWNNRSGWVNNELKINSNQSINIDIAPLNFSPTTYGFTFEIEFSTELVNDENAVILDLTSGSKGLKITASEASLISNNGREVSTKFRSGENTRITFVIDNAPVGNSKLSYIYVNGICTGVVDFISTDNYDVAKQITIGNTENAVINIRDIRIYRRALSSTEILNNYMLYRPTADEMLQIYSRNNIVVDGQISWEQLANYLPVMIVTGDIPILENTTNKKETIYVNIRYENRQDPERSFTMENATMTPQGTSSMYYPKKNFRIYTKKNNDTVLRIGSSEFGKGRIVENKLYAFKEKAQPVQTWCLKADYAESSSTHNTGVARLWNDALENIQINGKYVGRTLAQQAAIDNNYDYDVRTTVDGFPIVMFYHQTEDDPLIFLGKYNFNNDKSTESVFGFKDIPGFDNTHMQCWEQLDSGNAYGLFNGNPDNFDDNWSDAFEGRYPDGNEDISDLKTFYTWVYSCKDNQSKFDSEWGDHIDKYKMSAYYVYLMRFGGVDQVAKNAMLTSEDGVKWFFINYDNDTIFGLDNDGLLKYSWDIDRQTKIEGTDVYCYAAHDSLLWNLLEGCNEFMSLVPTVDQALYTARKGTEDVGLSYNNVINMFNNKQAGQWCERVYNEDANYKYINPFKNNSINQLGKLQGSRSAHRAWWIQNRWNLFDGKWMTGDFRKDGITFKCQAGAAGTTLNITSGNEMYYGIKVQTTVITSKSLALNQSADFAIDRELQIGTPVSICNPSNVQGINVSNFASNLASFDMAKVQNEYGETRLKDLILGKTGVINNFLNTISGIENATALQKINITGFKQITSLDLSNAYDLREVTATNSGLIDIHIPEGCPLEQLSLPDTLESLVLKNIDTFTLSKYRGSFKNIKSVEIHNCHNISLATLLARLILFGASMSKLKLSFYGIDNEKMSYTQLNSWLGQIDPNNLDLSGIIDLTQETDLTLVQLTKLQEMFGKNCFNPNNKLYIKLLEQVSFINTTDKILENRNYIFKAIYLTDSSLEMQYRLLIDNYVQKYSEKNKYYYAGGTEDVPEIKLYRYTGELSVNFIESKQTVSIAASRKESLSPQRAIDVIIDKLQFPTEDEVSITGDVTINDIEEHTFSLAISNQNVVIEPTTDYTTEWQLQDVEGSDIVSTGNVIITETKDNFVKVKGSRKNLEGSCNITATITLKSKEQVTYTKTIIVDFISSEIICTSRSNPKFMRAMYLAGFAENPNKMTQDEADAVTVLPDGVFVLENDENFGGKTVVVDSALELMKFNNLAEIKLLYTKKQIDARTDVQIRIAIPNSVKTFTHQMDVGYTDGRNEPVIVYEITDFKNYLSKQFNSKGGTIARVTFAYYSNHEIPTEIQIANSVPENAFHYLQFEGIVYISKGCKSIGKNAFSSSYINLIFKGDCDLQNIAENAFYYTQFGDKNIVLPQTLISITSPFYLSNIEAIDMSKCTLMTSLPANALSDTTNLKSVVLPKNTLHTIGAYSFRGCSNLSEVYIDPDNTTQFRVLNNAFNGCNKLSIISINTKNVYISEDGFGESFVASSTSSCAGISNTDGSNKFYVPADSTYYETAEFWTKYLGNEANPAKWTLIKSL